MRRAYLENGLAVLQRVYEVSGSGKHLCSKKE